jgi:hypothetical protein
MSKRKSSNELDRPTKKKPQLLIPVAKYGKVGSILKDITPDEYKDMKEVQLYTLLGWPRPCVS